MVTVNIWRETKQKLGSKSLSHIQFPQFRRERLCCNHRNRREKKPRTAQTKNAESPVSSLVTVEYVSTRCVTVVWSWIRLFEPVKKFSSRAWSKTDDYEMSITKVFLLFLVVFLTDHLSLTTVMDYNSYLN